MVHSQQLSFEQLAVMVSMSSSLTVIPLLGRALDVVGMRTASSCLRSQHSSSTTSPQHILASHAADSTNVGSSSLPAPRTSSPQHHHHNFAASRLGLDPSRNRFHAPLVYHEGYSFDGWPPNHTFPMDKFGRIAHALQTTCMATTPSSNLPRPLVRRPDDFFRPLDAADVPLEWLHGVIEAGYVDRFLRGGLTAEEARYVGFRDQTSRPELIERTVLEVAGTALAAQLACAYGIAANLAGGTHHAHPTGGAGYTILNDLAVTAALLTGRGGGGVGGSSPPSFVPDPVRRVLVIDLDVHQGDGTAKFSTLWREEDERVGVPPDDQRLFTLSMHCASNYPRPKANSTYDIGLRDGCGDDEYLQLLEDCVDRALSEVCPDVVLYDAGVDVYGGDQLGRLNLTEDGMRRRDRFVLDRCVSSGVPVAAVVGGGYDRDVDALARRHAIVHEECAYVWRKHRMWDRHS